MDTITLNPGEEKTAFFFINLKGRLFYKITNRSGTNKVNARWVKGPFGSSEDIGVLANAGNIPFKGLLWGKLKISNADSETRMQVTEDAQVAQTFPDISF
jgi:hypothetical protein